MLKQPKSSVNYRKGSDYDRCQLCRFFKLPSSCTRVAGRIVPQDICDLYEKVRNAFDYSPDKGEPKGANQSKPR